MRKYRYFIDFAEGQEKWLNNVAAKGYRLAKCGQISYDFEECAPGEYEYAVEFAADKSKKKSDEYKAFLESIGWRVIYKNVNVGMFIGKVKYRPWARDGGQFATSPGNFQKELMIIEKKADGKPFELHTGAADALHVCRTLRNAYAWTAAQMAAAAALCLILWAAEYRLSTAFPLWAGLACSALTALWTVPALKYAAKTKRLKNEIESLG